MLHNHTFLNHGSHYSCSFNKAVSCALSKVGKPRMALKVCLYGTDRYGKYTCMSSYSLYSCLTSTLKWQKQPGKHAVYQRDGWKDVCATAGFLHLYGIWLILGLSSWIGLYLLLVSFFKGYLLKNAMGEVFGILVVIFFPLTIIWLPFLHGMYGLTGIWCDIMPSEGGYGVSNSTSGVVYQMTLFYGPSFLAASLGTASVIFMVIAFCRHALNKNQELQRQYRVSLKETLPLLVFTVGFDIFTTINVVQGVYDALTVAKKNSSPSFGLWIAASLLPCSYCLLLMLIMCQPYIYNHFKCKKCRGIQRRATDQLYDIQLKPHSNHCSKLKPHRIHGIS